MSKDLYRAISEGRSLLQIVDEVGPQGPDEVFLMLYDVHDLDTDRWACFESNRGWLSPWLPKAD